jgi:hypothetical protein
MFTGRAEALRRRVLSPWGFAVYLWRYLPLAAFSGMRLQRLDAEECRVSLPGGWRTRNPFGSAYFAAQCMAAEMSTGAPALVLAEGAAASVALIVVSLEARFAKRVVGRSTYTFTDLAGMRDAIGRAAAGDEPVRFIARTVARTESDGELASEFDVTWSFKRRQRPSA